MAKRNYVNLNANPCKMCMPMGAVMAFKGIENSMVILHGSQGCSTYIRRHMAGHYNEPIDVASSSITENGTVFGGEKNLRSGLQNMIKLYSPSIIGVATTCLAETIGEDIERMCRKFSEESNVGEVKIVTVSTPGYGGTQFEGYHMALKSMVKSLAGHCAPHNKINVVTSCLSPGDTRLLKRILDLFDLEYILLPDVSETLDAPYKKEYNRMAEGGTRVSDIASMAGSRATIELGITQEEVSSCGDYLNKTYGVPLFQCPLPVGIENTDRLLDILSEVSGKPVPEALKKERGRYLDAMIDSHKYNGEGRAAIFGEPETVYSIAKLCFENGIKPVVVSTGSVNEKLSGIVDEAEGEKPLITDDTDFETLEGHVAEKKANVLIGNSDGKVLTERLGIPLVRVGFPIHDRIGGQRLTTLFYEGSLRLMDEITNTLLENKYTGYRKNMYDKYFKEEAAGKAEASEETRSQSDNGPQEIALSQEITIEQRTKEHPCFGKGACHNARMHLPVAPLCNISCNYCNRRFDCVNESRPGVTSEILSPVQAAEKFRLVKSKVPNLKVVGIAGPGDALANIENTKESLRLIREIDPEVTFCLSTNGLMLPYHAYELMDLGVTHFTVTVNAIDTAILSRIYKYINFMGLRLTGEEGCKILLENQLAGIRMLTARGAVVKVNTVMIKGVNDQHIEEVVKAVKACGAQLSNIMPLIPAKGSRFENYPQTSQIELREMRKKCGESMEQMLHCRQCRADAIGTLDKDVSLEFSGCPSQKGETAPSKGSVPEVGREKPVAGIVLSEDEKPYFWRFAVSSKTGMLVDQHFGHSQEFYIYEADPAGIRFVEKRPVSRYCNGGEECEEEGNKIDKMLKVIGDCHMVITLRIGYNPSQTLVQKGISVITTCGRIEDCLKEALDSLNKNQKAEVDIYAQT